MDKNQTLLILVVIALILIVTMFDFYYKEIKKARTLAANYKRQRDNLLEFIQNSYVGSGVCCCGDPMKGHANPMDCGHTPRDQWDYLVEGWIEDCQRFDIIQESKNG